MFPEDERQRGSRPDGLGWALKLGLVRRRQPVLVEVYTRVGCGLCEDAERLVAEEAASEEVRYVDVDTDPELQRRYHLRVPVVAVNGQEIAEARVTPGSVRRAVGRARRGWSRGAQLDRDDRTRAVGRPTKEET